MQHNPYRTEFFESAAKMGFYGLDRSGLSGKKDNVRKYWEDTVTKLLIRPALEQLSRGRQRLRIVDLGCGSGEGLELIAHVPYPERPEPPFGGFLLHRGSIEEYVGLDVSPGMLDQARRNYASHDNARFLQHDLSGGFPLLGEPPFDFYFSSYSSLSHLTAEGLQRLMVQVFGHIKQRGYVLLDLLGRLSPEWPSYWWRSCHEMLPYNMAYLLPPEQRVAENLSPYMVCYWDAHELEQTLQLAAAKAGRQVSLEIVDRSVLVGRHMETGLFNGCPGEARYQVNRLFDRGYRGNMDKLRLDLPFLADYQAAHPQAAERIRQYVSLWNWVIDLVDALLKNDEVKVRRLIESAQPSLSEDLRMLTWLHRSRDRFPVADFWASIMGPQLACVLRNIEMTLGKGLGCGHGLLCLVEVTAT